jgi:antitoxin component of MazEF toxin-antitoxin module
VAEDVDVGEGTPVRVETRKGALVITPVRAPRHAVGDLLAGIKPSNLHCEVEFGEPLGREAW